ncbi:hypothetical protein D3C81_1871360 [compost metagenome]
MNIDLDENHIDSGILLAGIQLDLDRALRFDFDRHIRTEGGDKRTAERLTKRNMLRLIVQFLQRGLDDLRRL